MGRPVVLPLEPQQGVTDTGADRPGGAATGPGLAPAHPRDGRAPRAAGDGQSHRWRTRQGRDGKRLNPRKGDLHRWRETFAEKLRDWGIEAEASSQATRGVSRRSLRGWERQPGAASRTGKKRSEHKSGPAFRATRSGALR